MSDHDVLNLIKQADKAISAEDFEALMEFYADDAVLVVQPGQIARGKCHCTLINQILRIGRTIIGFVPLILIYPQITPRAISRCSALSSGAMPADMQPKKWRLSTGPTVWQLRGQYWNYGYSMKNKGTKPY